MFIYGMSVKIRKIIIVYGSWNKMINIIRYMGDKY